jgi:hypothetical protein
MSLAQQYPELFALHGGAAPVQPTPDNEETGAAPGPCQAWAETLAAIPASPTRAALVELRAIMAAHPVRVWGEQRGEGWACGIEADEAWKIANAALWLKAHGLWARVLGLLASHCRQLLPSRDGKAAGPSPPSPRAGQTTPGGWLLLK